MRYAFLALVSLAATAAAGDVWVVDVSGGGDFTEIQPAVETAQDGDVVLVKAGEYEAVWIGHKGLAIVADAGAHVIVDGGIFVEQTLVHHEVVLVGLEARGVKYQENGVEWEVAVALELDTTRGPVRIEDCVFLGADGDNGWDESWAWPGEPAVRIVRGLDVAFSNCTVIGGEGDEWYSGHEDTRGGDALVVRGGSVALFGCTAKGGKGASSPDNDCLCDGGNGGHGASVLDDPVLGSTVLYASGTSFHGGDGGSGDPGYGSGCLQQCGNGGHGLVLEGPTTVGHLLEVDLAGGLGACHDCGALWDGEDGSLFVTSAGATVNGISGWARDLEAPSPVRESTTASLVFTGRPGDLVYLLDGPLPSFTLQLPWNGVLLLRAPGLMGFRFMGTISSGTQLHANFPVPALGAAAESATIFLQSLHRDPTGRRWLGAHSAMVVLDAGL